MRAPPQERAPGEPENALRTVPLPAYLIPELKRWKLACPVTARGLVFPGEPDANGVRGPIEADVLLWQILRRALRKHLGNKWLRGT